VQILVLLLLLLLLVVVVVGVLLQNIVRTVYGAILSCRGVIHSADPQVSSAQLEIRGEFNVLYCCSSFCFSNFGSFRAISIVNNTMS
jgi:hypothetical protein